MPALFQTHWPRPLTVVMSCLYPFFFFLPFGLAGKGYCDLILLGTNDARMRCLQVSGGKVLALYFFWIWSPATIRYLLAQLYRTRGGVIVDSPPDWNWDHLYISVPVFRAYSNFKHRNGWNDCGVIEEFNIISVFCRIIF
jgi:hypothetical protein